MGSYALGAYCQTILFSIGGLAGMIYTGWIIGDQFIAFRADTILILIPLIYGTIRMTELASIQWYRIVIQE